MNPEQIRAFQVKVMDEVYNKLNADAVDKYFAEDFVNHNPAMPKVCNREDLKKWLRTLAKAYPNNISGTIDDILVEGDQYAVRWTFHGTGKGILLGVDVTGKEATSPGMCIFRLKNDKIAEQWWAYDMLGFAQQLGIIPLPGQAAKAKK